MNRKKRKMNRSELLVEMAKSVNLDGYDSGNSTSNHGRSVPATDTTEDIEDPSACVLDVYLGNDRKDIDFCNSVNDRMSVSINDATEDTVTNFACALDVNLDNNENDINSRISTPKQGRSVPVTDTTENPSACVLHSYLENDEKDIDFCTSVNDRMSVPINDATKDTFTNSACALDDNLDNNENNIDFDNLVKNYGISVPIIDATEDTVNPSAYVFDVYIENNENEIDSSNVVSNNAGISVPIIDASREISTSTNSICVLDLNIENDYNDISTDNSLNKEVVSISIIDTENSQNETAPSEILPLNSDNDPEIMPRNSEEDPKYSPSHSSQDDDDDGEFTKHKRKHEDDELTNSASPIGDGVQPSTPKRKRQKIADPSSWKQNKRKADRQAGKSYLATTGDIKPAVKIKPVPCKDYCLRHCNEIGEDKREAIFSSFWSIPNLNKRRQYVSSLIERMKTARTRSLTSKRSYTNNYYLIDNSRKVQVCKQFFLATLSISEKFMRCALNSRDAADVTSDDKRGCHKPGITRPEDARAGIRDHINSFPRVPSHYNRKNSQKEYLYDNLNLTLMYEAYKTKCEDDGINPEKEWLYRDVFHKDFNIAFHKPRKDQCDTCYKFNHMDENEKESMKEEFEKHVESKNLAREEKEKDKVLAVESLHHMAEFDLQAVLYCPNTNAKALFYKRRTACYNLTVFNPVDKNVICYTWDETVAKRGSNEIASCVFSYLKKIEDGKSVVLFSDSCGGQNRNYNMCGMLLYAVKNLNIPEINHKYLVPGHTQMEVDSVHSTIEKAKKKVHVYEPSGWNTVIQMARKKPYEVEEMSNKEIINFKLVSDHLIKNKKVDVEGNVVHWLKIVNFKYLKDDPEHIYFKYQMNEEFKKFNVGGNRKSCRRKSSGGNILLKPAFNNPIPISKAKIKDLKDLCASGIIRSPYNKFYEQLTCSEEVEDDIISTDEEENSSANKP